MLPFFVSPSLFFEKFNVWIKGEDAGIFRKNYVWIKEGDKDTHHRPQSLDWDSPPGGCSIGRW